MHICPHTGHTLLATCQSSELAVLEWQNLDECRIYSHPNKFYQVRGWPPVHPRTHAQSVPVSRVGLYLQCSDGGEVFDMRD